MTNQESPGTDGSETPRSAIPARLVKPDSWEIRDLRRLPLLWAGSSVIVILGVGVQVGRWIAGWPQEARAASSPNSSPVGQVFAGFAVFLSPSQAPIGSAHAPGLNPPPHPDLIVPVTVQKGSNEADILSANEQIGRGDYDGAEASLTAVLKVEPRNAQVLRLRAYVRGLRGQGPGLDSPSLSDLEKAREDVEAALGIDNEDGWSHFQHGWLLSELEGVQRTGMENSVKEYDEAIRLLPRLAKAYYNRGWAKKQLGQFEAASADFLSAAQIVAEDSGFVLPALSERSKCLAALDRSEAQAANDQTLGLLKPE